MSFPRLALGWQRWLFLSSLLALAPFLSAVASAQVASPTPAQSSSSSTAQDNSVAQANAAPPDSRNKDVALSVFGQVSGASNGNFIRVDTSGSMGGLLSFRREFRPFVGLEANYGLTRYSDYYNRLIRVNHDAHELNLSYLLQPAKFYYGFQPFFTIGGGIMIFAPISNAQYSAQLLPAFVYGLGINHNVLSDHIGVRVQYRAEKYKAPNFGQVSLDAHRLRTTMEPSFGVYYRF
jgi:hypothetical protein